MIDLTIGHDVRLIGTSTPTMKVHRHLDDPSHLECIWFNTQLELQIGIFNKNVLEEYKPAASQLKGEFPE